jgi:Predicted O-methyltransferase
MNIVNDVVTEYINGFYKPMNPLLNSLRVEAERMHVPIILRETETLILNIIRLKRPLRILEIGTAVGYSAICFAKAFSGAEVISLESNDEMYNTALDNIGKAELQGRVHVIHGDAVESLKELTKQIQHLDSKAFDLVFIDASKGHYKEFWDASIPLCKSDAIIISDNVLLKAWTASDEYVADKRYKTSVRRMREYLKYITEIENVYTSILSVGDGIAVSALRGQR